MDPTSTPRWQAACAPADARTVGHASAMGLPPASVPPAPADANQPPWHAYPPPPQGPQQPAPAPGAYAWAMPPPPANRQRLFSSDDDDDDDDGHRTGFEAPPPHERQLFGGAPSGAAGGGFSPLPSMAPPPLFDSAGIPPRQVNATPEPAIALSAMDVATPRRITRDHDGQGGSAPRKEHSSEKSYREKSIGFSMLSVSAATVKKQLEYVDALSGSDGAGGVAPAPPAQEAVHVSTAARPTAPLAGHQRQHKARPRPGLALFGDPAEDGNDDRGTTSPLASPDTPVGAPPDKRHRAEQPWAQQRWTAPQ
jgi:hypothetical protein